MEQLCWIIIYVLDIKSIYLEYLNKNSYLKHSLLIGLLMFASYIKVV